jgi:biopolymer transport protein ExbD
MRKRDEVALFGNLTAMIDVVFQIIIFFVCTANLESNSRNALIKLAPAPHGTAATKDPLEIVVEVSSSGTISICRTALSPSILANVMRKAVAEHGSAVPVIIRADGRAKHSMVRAVMDTCAGSGIWKIKIVALKEKGR